MTTKLEQAARQALEALEELHYSSGTVVAVKKYEIATAALREALAEQPDTPNVDCACGDLYPADSFGAGFIAATGHCQNCDVAEQAEQEPVGYWDGKFSKGGASALYEVPQESAFGYHYENYPLYAAPVRTKDLTRDEIEEVVSAWWKEDATQTYQDLCKAAIAADREKNK